MRIILLGPPGSGKGTQSAWISQHYHIPVIATGDLLRIEIAQQSTLGLQTETILKKGGLVPDEWMIRLIRQRLTQADCQKGYILDGFPRTVVQAETLKKEHIAINVVLELTVPEAILLERLTGRRVHLASGRVYHIQYNPPKVANIDDLTREPLVQRSDDQPSVIQKRLEVYYKQTEPVLTFYKKWAANRSALAPKLFSLQSDLPISILRHQIIQLLNRV